MGKLSGEMDVPVLNATTDQNFMGSSFKVDFFLTDLTVGV
jgi:hypothetical protein